MAAALLALLTLVQAAPAADAPVRTAPSSSIPSSAPVQQPLVARTGATPPEDDYGYVAWCYGAIETYLNLYDRVMPEVARIERAFPSPRGIEEDLKVYPQMREQARSDLKTLTAAIVAAEKASPQAIAPYGAASMRRGQAVWSGSTQVAPAELAREWMGWSPPRKCEETARALTVKSTVLGQALIYNQPSAVPAAQETAPAPPPLAGAPVTPVINTPTPPAPAPRPVTPQPAPPPPSPAPAPPPPAPRPVIAAVPAAPPRPAAATPAPVRTAVAAPRATSPAAAVAASGPQVTLPPGAYVMDPDSNQGCRGRLDASIRAGRIVMVCLPQ